jgi:hypothetical protein
MKAGRCQWKGPSLGQLVIVSNRVAVPEKNAKARAGGLEVAVKAALKQKSGIWFGWSGKVATQTKIATPSGNRSNNECRSPGRLATSVVNAPGLSAPSIPVGDTAGVESQCCTAPANYSRAGAATDWPTRASKNRHFTAGLERHRKFA